MNFLGMGPMEMILIFLVAFLLLGHERMIETAKLLGKAVKEIRRISTNISQIIPEDEIRQTIRETEDEIRQTIGETNVQPKDNNSTSQLKRTPESTNNNPVSPEGSVEFRSPTNVPTQETSNEETNKETTSGA